eukprot:TRINITY_DN2011_c0_g1_i2.p1 TRINITY_DN2011_c0_g1~~TRINITY_DN2011_c0_g1_i2.p1  ORF type:complete len:366 (+),score=67.25 TRINITY_DN2011_c0_g1_i2:143-1240(+)
MSYNSDDSSLTDEDSVESLVLESSKEDRKTGRWTNTEDLILQEAVSKYGAKNWKLIASHIEGRTDVQCLHRWQRVTNPALVKGPWTKREDALLRQLVEQLGTKSWSRIAKKLNSGRNGKQCRERYCNHLDPLIKKGDWTPEEDSMLLEKHARWGNKWSKIALFLPGRSPNSIKNHFNSTIQRKIRRSAGPASINNQDEYLVTSPSENQDLPLQIIQYQPVCSTVTKSKARKRKRTTSVSEIKKAPDISVPLNHWSPMLEQDTFLPNYNRLISTRDPAITNDSRFDHPSPEYFTPSPPGAAHDFYLCNPPESVYFYGNLYSNDLVSGFVESSFYREAGSEENEPPPKRQKKFHSNNSLHYPEQVCF